MFNKAILFGCLTVAAATVALVGCGKTPPSASAPHKDKEGVHKEGDSKEGVHKDGDHKDGEGHGHKPGTHGGIIVSLGKDSYHAEAVFAKDGDIHLYLLGKDEVQPQEVEVQELVAYATPVDSTEPVQVKFAAERKSSDAAGKTSQFVAKLPPELHGKKVKITINNIRIGAERFRIEFSNEKGDH